MFSRVRRCCGACGLGKRRDRPCVADAPRKTPILNPYRVFFCICLRKRKRGFLQKGPALPAPVPVSPWPVSPWPVSPWPDALRPLASCGYLSRGWLHLGFFPGCFGAFFFCSGFPRWGGASITMGTVLCIVFWAARKQHLKGAAVDCCFLCRLQSAVC